MSVLFTKFKRKIRKRFIMSGILKSIASLGKERTSEELELLAVLRRYHDESDAFLNLELVTAATKAYQRLAEIHRITRNKLDNSGDLRDAWYRLIRVGTGHPFIDFLWPDILGGNVGSHEDIFYPSQLLGRHNRRGYVLLTMLHADENCYWSEDHQHWRQREPDRLIYGAGENVLNHCVIQSLPEENTKLTSMDGLPVGFPFLGVELEVESQGERDPAAKRILKDLNGAAPNKNTRFAILKTDGSLDGARGIEIVSTPATLSYHKQAWQKFFEKGKGASSILNSFTNTNGRCGMHVHISRNAFSPLTLGKFLQFINDKNNNSFITKIAGRDKSHYTRFLDKKIKDCKTPFQGQKYEAVNLCHPHTLEIRIFKGNVSEIGFFKNLEFVHAAYNFCRETGASKLSYTDFTNWLKDNQKEYPYLIAWLIMNGFLDKDILPKSGYHSAAYDIMKRRREERRRVNAKRKKRGSKSKVVKLNKNQKIAQAVKKMQSPPKPVEVVAGTPYPPTMTVTPVIVTARVTF